MQQQSSADPLRSPVRFGVLGTGRITRRLVAELQQAAGVQVTAIASREETRARWYADQFGIPSGVHGYEALVSSDAIDAVYVALPPALHAEWACAAAVERKHILCEKPLMTSGTEAARLDAVCAEHNAYWLDATGWLHHPRTQAMRREIDSGALGRVRHISATVSFFEPFQSGDHRLVDDLGGGCLLDLGWYAFGAAVWAAGNTAPRRVRSIGARDRGIWNRITSIFEFDRQITASVHCAYDVATRKWFEIAGDAASIVCDDFTRSWPDKVPRYWVHDRAGAVRAEATDGQQERAMIAALVDEINGLKDLSPMRRQAIATQRTLDAVEHSLREDRAVSLPATEDPRCE